VKRTTAASRFAVIVSNREPRRPPRCPSAPGVHASTVVRVGDTVQRETSPWTPAVLALARHLEAADFLGAPHLLAIDAQGREVLTFIPGAVLQAASPDIVTGAELGEVGRQLPLHLLLQRNAVEVVGIPVTRAATEVPVWQTSQMRPLTTSGARVRHGAASGVATRVAAAAFAFPVRTVAGAVSVNGALFSFAKLLSGYRARVPEYRQRQDCGQSSQHVTSFRHVVLPGFPSHVRAVIKANSRHRHHPASPSPAAAVPPAAPSTQLRRRDLLGKVTSNSEHRT
jgi:hypothetical protein